MVPVAGQGLDTDPFKLVERDGKLYGRGTCDMKGYLACALAMVPDLKARKLEMPFHIAFSYDEEVGCTGVRPMIAELGKTLPLPRMVFVGEPSKMAVVDAHKGPARWRVELTGRAAHSSMPHYGVNAIAYAGRLIGELLRMEEELKASTRNPRFDPPWTTMQVTQIEGGTASNVVPVPCWFGWETRALPGFDPMTLDRRLKAFAAETCLPEMRRVAPEADIRIMVTNRVPAYAADTKSGIVPLTLKLAGQNETLAVSYCTEAGLFQDGGAPAIICGPGDIAQAHTANEFVAVPSWRNAWRSWGAWRTGRRLDLPPPQPDGERVSEGSGSRSIALTHPAAGRGDSVIRRAHDLALREAFHRHVDAVDGAQPCRRKHVRRRPCATSLPLSIRATRSPTLKA